MEPINPYEKALCNHSDKNSLNHVHTHVCIEGWDYPEIPLEAAYYVRHPDDSYTLANPQPTLFPIFPRRWPAIVGALLLGLILGWLSMAYTLAHIWLD